MPLKKRERQALIKKLITEETISTHSELLQALKKLGCKINQPTISRDLRELGVIKVQYGLNKMVYKLTDDNLAPSATEFSRKCRDFITDIKHTGNMILIFTRPGDAQGLARVIDKARLKHVLGTVAGDDTIFVIIDQKKNTKKIVQYLKAHHK